MSEVQLAISPAFDLVRVDYGPKLNQDSTGEVMYGAADFNERQYFEIRAQTEHKLTPHVPGRRASENDFGPLSQSLIHRAARQQFAVDDSSQPSLVAPVHVLWTR